jgi:hypothetical protein
MCCSGSYEYICLRGRGFESPWSHLCFLNLILARRGMYVGIGMVRDIHITYMGRLLFIFFPVIFFMQPDLA